MSPETRKQNRHASRSHSPVGRHNRNNSNHDHDHHTSKKKGRRQKGHSQQEEMESELNEMLCTMNVSGHDSKDSITLDTTANSRASARSSREGKKKKKSSRSGKKERTQSSEDVDDQLEAVPLPDNYKALKRTKSLKSTSSSHKSSTKGGKKKHKKRSSNSSGDGELVPLSPDIISTSESASSNKKNKKSSKRTTSRTAAAAAAAAATTAKQELLDDIPIDRPPLSDSNIQTHHKKPKKKKRSRTKSPSRSGLPTASNHTKGSTALPDASGKSAIRNTTGKSSSGATKPARRRPKAQGGSPKANTIFDTTSNSNHKSSPSKSPGLLRRVVSDREGLLGASRIGSASNGSSGDGGKNKLRRAKSLFGAVLNSNSKGADTVGDGDHIDNEYEMKLSKASSTKQGIGSGKGGLLGWAKNKIISNVSPGNYRKKRLGLGKGTSDCDIADYYDDDDDDNDHEGLLDNAENGSGHMSLLNLMPDPAEEEKKKKKEQQEQKQKLKQQQKQRQAESSNIDKDFLLEDNKIEELDEFKMPTTNATNNNIAQHQRSSKPPNNMNSDADARPPFNQIISTVNITTDDDDDLSDIGDPEDNIQKQEILDDDDLVEIIYDPERNDVIYDEPSHPGTIRLLHVLREMIMEKQDDIEYSPEVYKYIKRRLKGRKFLVRTRITDQKAFREATKTENVRLLADYFHEEMRQLLGGSITIGEENAKRKKKNNKHLNKSSHSQGCMSADGTIMDKLLQRAIAECKWAQEIAKPNGDIDMMNIGIDAEEKLIALIEIADTGHPETEPLKAELDKLGELAKQMMYVSIAPLYDRLEEIEENMTGYFEQEGVLDDFDVEDEDEDEDEEEFSHRQNNTSRDMSRDMSLEKDGEVYEVAMKMGASYEVDMNFSDDGEETDDEETDFHEDDEEEPHPDEYDEESDEESNTNVKEGEVLKCDHTDDDLSSVGVSDESESDEDNSEDEGEERDWAEFDDEDDEDESDQGSETSEGSDEDLDASDDEPIRKKSIFDEPNPKLQQFFDRLNHFFETRKRIEERAAAKDPSNKCRKIKAKAHSGGLAKKSGVYKTEFQQRDTSNRVVRNLDDLYNTAEAAYADFKSIVQQLVDDISGLDFKKNIILSQLKSRDRAYEKAKTEYGSREPGPPESWLYDICRAGIVCNTVKQLSEVSKWLISNTHVVQAKNRFAEPAFNGYRDLLYHVSIPYQDGNSHICEIQVHLKDIYVMNDQCGTIKHYDYFRSCFSNPYRSQEDALLDLQTMIKYTKIEGPFMKKLLKSDDPDQLLLFAGMFRKKLEEYDRSLELYRRVLGLQEKANGIDNEEMADTYLSIGLVLGAMGDTDDSLQNLLKALAIQESFLGADHVEVADSYVEIGHMLSKRGDYSGAYTQYQRTLLIRENKLGKEHFLVIKSLQDIGLVLQKKGDFEESEKEYRKALVIQKDVLGEGHQDVATTHFFIGTTLCLYGDFEKAMVEHKLALSMREKGLGKNHRSAAESHTAIGVLLFQKGDYKTSRWHHNKALKIHESMLGKDDEECAISHRYLGELLSYYEGDYEGAVKELKRAQEILEANVGMDHPITADSYLDLGHIHCRHGKHEEALAVYRRAKVILESNLGQTHPDTAATYMCTGNALNLAGDQDTALQMHRKALVVFESVLGNSHPRTADGYQSTGDAYAARGHPEMALSEHREALKIRKAVLRKDHPSVAESSARIGNILLTGCDSNGNLNERDADAALEIYREALAITEERCGKDNPAAAVARFDVSFALVTLAFDDDKRLEKPELLIEAEEKLRETLEVLREVDPLEDKESKASISFFLGFGDKAAITGRACVALGTVLEQNGNDEGAKEIFVEGHKRLIAVLGGDHPDTLEAESKLLSLVAES